MIQEIQRLRELLKKKNELPSLDLNIGRSMYQKTHFMGSERANVDTGLRLLSFAQQFRPIRINGTLFRNSYCAYRGLGAPLKISPATGTPEPKGYHEANLDHIIPRSVNGEEHPFNLQLLSAWYNSLKFKGGLSTFHSRWHAFRKAGEIDGLPFVELADLFFWCFDAYHAHPNMRNIINFDICFAWPWWAREPRPPFRPILHGYDESRKMMSVTKEESYLLEFSVLAQNSIRFLKMTESNPVKTAVREAYDHYYRMSPESMASFSRKRL